MRIFVKVKTRAGEERIEKIDDKHYLVAVKEIPVDNRANRAVVKLIAKHFKMPSSTVRIVSGAGSKTKLIEIP